MHPLWRLLMEEANIVAVVGLVYSAEVQLQDQHSFEEHAGINLPCLVLQDQEILAMVLEKFPSSRQESDLTSHRLRWFSLPVALCRSLHFQAALEKSLF